MRKQATFVQAKPQKDFLDVRVFTYEHFLALLLVVSLFLTTFYFRAGISSVYAYLNLPFYIAIVLIAVHFGGRFDATMFLLWLVMSCLFLFAEVRAGTGVIDIVQFFALYCLPLLVCQLRVMADPVRTKHFAATCIRLINVATLSVFAILLIDLVTGSAVMRFVVGHVIPGLSSWVSGDVMSRHASIWGHYLLTAGFYLAFYYLNIAYQKIYNSSLINIWVLYVVASVGILSTGGKTALVIYLVSVAWLTLAGRHRARNAIVLTIFFVGLYLLGGFDIVLGRFGAQDLSSGRNDALATLLSAEQPHLLIGYGEDFLPHMSAYASPNTIEVASEYSFVALAYKFGILFVVLMIILFLYQPFRVSRAVGNWTILFMVAMLVVYFTTFNAFTVIPDAYDLVALFVFITAMFSGEGDHVNVRPRINRHSDVQTIKNAGAGDQKRTQAELSAIRSHCR